MATYAIGDVQGCYDPLQRLLERLRFDPSRDALRFVGDLVDRGPRSLEVLRLVRSLGDAAVTVLGNHDLSLLAALAECHPPARNHTLDAIFEAHDRPALTDWLRSRPMIHYETALASILVHAGIPPQWDLEQALACAAELEAALRGPDWRAFLGAMYGDHPALWEPALRGHDRLRFITNALTRMRYCHPDGRLDLRCKQPPDDCPQGLMPWFRVPGRRPLPGRIVFGHWAALGLHREQGLLGLDSGCVWGGQLTAVRLDGPPVITQCECVSRRR